MRRSLIAQKSRLTLSALLLLLSSGAAFSPIVWMAMSALKTNPEIFQNPWAPPKEAMWGHFSEAWRVGSLGRYLGNSLWVTGASVVLILAASSAAGYAGARLRFRGQGVIRALYLLGLILPIQGAVIPLFFLLKKMGLLNHLLSLILCYAAWGLPLSVVIFQGFFAQVPKEIEEAGRMDGCSELTLYLRIFLPLCKPAAGTVALFAILSSWNELLMALLFIEEESLKTIPVGLLAFFGYRQADYSLLLSGLTLVTLPTLILYFALQSTVMRGLAGGLHRN